MRPVRRLLAAALVLAWAVPAWATPPPPRPFPGVNRSPLAGLHAPLPPQPSDLPAEGRVRLRLTAEAASHFIWDDRSDERVRFDGETQVVRLAAAWGLGWGEVGAELPVVAHNGGVFDGFIEGWHRFFHLPQGGRDEAPHGLLEHRYEGGGEVRKELDGPAWGLGDAWVWAGREVPAPVGATGALRGWVRLPTGRADDLLGSGSVQGGIRVDLAGRVSALRAGWYAGAAAWAGTPGRVVPERRRPWGIGGNLGAEWAPVDRVVLRVQLDAATPAYRSPLVPVGAMSVQLWTGGSLRLTPGAWLDLAVGEDVAVGTAPDVTFLASVRWEP